MASTTGTPETPAAEPRELDNLSDSQYSEWRKSGKVPVDGEAAGASEGDAGKKDSAPSEQAPPKREQQREGQRREPTRMGYGDLRRAVRELREENARLKSERTREVPEAEETEPPSARAAERSETAASKDRPKPTLNDKTADGKPKYATYEDWVEDLADWKAEQKLSARDADAQKRERDDAASRAQRAEGQRALSVAEKGRAKYDDFDAVALNKDLPLIRGSAAHQWIEALAEDKKPDVAADMAYYFGENPDELEQINRLSPVAAARHLTALEAELSGEEPEEEAAPITRPTGTPKKPLPPPTKTVAGRGAAPPDEIRKAVAEDDFEGFQAAANRRDLARRKSGR